MTLKGRTSAGLVFLLNGEQSVLFREGERGKLLLGRRGKQYNVVSKRKGRRFRVGVFRVPCEIIKEFLRGKLPDF